MHHHPPPAGWLSTLDKRPGSSRGPMWKRSGAATMEDMAKTDVVTVRGLRKTYGNLVVVDRLDLDVPAGEIVGLAGADGAGKTTTVECIQGVRRPDAGLLGILGDEPRRVGPLLETFLFRSIPFSAAILIALFALVGRQTGSPRRRDLRKRSWGRPRPTAGRRSPAQRTACGGWCSRSAPASWPWDCSAPSAGPPAPPGGPPPCSTLARRAAPSSAVPGLGKNIWTVPIVCTQNAMSRGAT
jgi:energy-coupling factor transporter ATP-binding protein EcfA2